MASIPHSINQENKGAPAAVTLGTFPGVAAFANRTGPSQCGQPASRPQPPEDSLLQGPAL